MLLESYRCAACAIDAKRGLEYFLVTAVGLADRTFAAVDTKMS